MIMRFFCNSVIPLITLYDIRGEKNNHTTMNFGIRLNLTNHVFSIIRFLTPTLIVTKKYIIEVFNLQFIFVLFEIIMCFLTWGKAILLILLNATLANVFVLLHYLTKILYPPTSKNSQNKCNTIYFKIKTMTNAAKKIMQFRNRQMLLHLHEFKSWS